MRFDSFIFTSVRSVIQLTFQVLPPSSENDCSKWAEFRGDVRPNKSNQDRSAIRPDGSVSKNSPRPFLTHAEIFKLFGGATGELHD